MIIAVVVYGIIGVLFCTLRPASRRLEDTRGFNRVTAIWIVLLGCLVMLVFAVACIMLPLTLRQGFSALMGVPTASSFSLMVTFVPALAIAGILVIIRISGRPLGLWRGAMASGALATFSLLLVAADQGLSHVFELDPELLLLSFGTASCAFLLTWWFRDWLGVRTVFQ